MLLDISHDSKKVYAALASDTRLEMIRLLSQKARNIKELSEILGISNAIVTRHIQQLEKARLIRTEKIPGKSGLQKVSKLIVDNIQIEFPAKIYPDYKSKQVELPVGHYTDYFATPTCGLATENKIIGFVDEPKYFMDPERVQAQIVWFTQGFLEYKISNPLNKNEVLKLLEISFEISSEFPYSNNVWPSDITFYVNNRQIGTWTCPGNFSDIRGKRTPEWWDDANSQYGLFKTIRISEHGCHFDGELLSKLTIEDLALQTEDIVTLRISVEEDAKHIGGATIFGKEFGNHDRDIDFKFYYIEG
ncbi:ArsR/SmtB family transcription factor [Heyndrickxia ginsengihumi]|uniref:ArsR family transcriptional regulator n=1 Tax=Heyndrickxia ginsengihumi TaxID=363870 RepID=A0A6M0PBC6_9BACI|nr:ArsR family transcriptional regulator [Heyndrickxia ginsengihumi]MBE6183503.1 ArsR family transcriptional regulator [Bacillus sp. (in: firmicutes)]NEY21743.1 ArsR family transcriptional regulator [Heyndrickxia ginsengihumi]